MKFISFIFSCILLLNFCSQEQIKETNTCEYYIKDFGFKIPNSQLKQNVLNLKKVSVLDPNNSMSTVVKKIDDQNMAFLYENKSKSINLLFGKTSPIELKANKSYSINNEWIFYLASYDKQHEKSLEKNHTKQEFVIYFIKKTGCEELIDNLSQYNEYPVVPENQSGDNKFPQVIKKPISEIDNDKKENSP